MISLLNSIGSVALGILYVVIAILFLMIMITIHELGHYVAGKIFKFKINEFSIGFGKAIYSKTNKKTGEKFSIRIIPLGGYCAFDGEDEESENSHSFNKMAWWKRLIVLFSGAFFNFLSALIVGIFVLIFIGDGVTKITHVVSDYDIYTNPNYSIVETVDKIHENDIFLKVNGKRPTFINGGLAGVNSSDETCRVTVQRNGEILEITLERFEYPVFDENNQPVHDRFTGDIITQNIFGISQTYVTYGFFDALLQVWEFVLVMGWECLVLIIKLFTGQLGLENAGGMVTVVSAIAKSSQANALNLLLFFPIIAVNLAVFNWLPLPALDGGRMVFVIIEAIRRKPIKREIENKIHTIGLIALFAFVILVDVLQIFLFRRF